MIRLKFTKIAATPVSKDLLDAIAFSAENVAMATTMMPITNPKFATASVMMNPAALRDIDDALIKRKSLLREPGGECDPKSIML